jgi:LysM repeat protein
LELAETEFEPQTLVIAPPEPEPEPVIKLEEPPRDEIDQMLKNYAVIEEVKVLQEVTKVPPFVEVTVKRGDSLDKISRANGTTVKAIMQANRLASPRIDVGQILKIPTSQSKETALAEPSSKQQSQEVEYYTLKSGDNPWKVAKQFKVRFDQLLELNGLDEDKARNLKPGDTLRVK